MGIQVLYAQDVLLLPLYLIFTFFFAFIYRNAAYRNDPAGNILFLRLL
jgi:predicted membrane protein